MELDEIGIADFQAYEDVRQSGVCNMLSSEVEDLAGISRETKAGIMKWYAELCKKYPTVRDLEEE